MIEHYEVGYHSLSATILIVLMSQCLKTYYLIA